MSTRQVEREITIDAPVAVVWKALTDAAELVRWFPLEARVTPGAGGAGGAIWMRWDGVYDAESRIEIWEPERHLRIGFPNERAFHLATDYYLERKGGGTVLRVVTSGFGAGDDWDAQYGGVSRGWDFELLALRHYLERHRGRDRAVAWVRAAYRCSRQEAWARLTGPRGWFGQGGISSLVEGASYATRTATGHTLTGAVQLWRPPLQFSGTVDGWNDALFRLELSGKDGAGEAWLWLATYGVPTAQVRAIQDAWQESAGGVFAR